MLIELRVFGAACGLTVVGPICPVTAAGERGAYMHTLTDHCEKVRERERLCSVRDVEDVYCNICDRARV